jgi:SAM-dependent methyltransferase
MEFVNCYADSGRASAYATLEFANTYYLAYRDLPALIARHAVGTRALDFGCGTGRSTRFLQKLGFDVVGVDVSEEMVAIARSTDPDGVYRLIPGDNFDQFKPASFDLILSAFTFDNIPGSSKTRIFRDLRNLLAPSGTLVSVVSSPDIYLHDWASFTTGDFPENARAKSGDLVRIIVTDHVERRPVEDILCTHESYLGIYKEAKLQIADVVKPLAQGDEPYAWVNETRIAPWIVYVLKRSA